MGYVHTKARPATDGGFEFDFFLHQQFMACSDAVSAGTMTLDGLFSRLRASLAEGERRGYKDTEDRISFRQRLDELEKAHGEIELLERWHSI
jgi:hypothetical protein